MTDQTPAHPDVMPGFEHFWAPAPETENSLEQVVQESESHFGQSRRAKYELGVVYNGPWETLNDGVCIAVRRNACALRRAGMPVFLSSLTHKHWNRGIVESSFHHELPPAVLAEVGHLTECEHEKTLARVLHFVPTTDFLVQQTRPSIAGMDVTDVMLSRTIAYMALEMDTFPGFWIESFNKLGRIVVPCEKSKADLTKAGVACGVEVIPHPMMVLDPMRKARPAPRQQARFLHVGKWEPRKNQHKLIGAFLRAFEPGSPNFLHLHCKPFWGAKPYPVTFDESRHLWLETAVVRQRGWNRQTFEKHVTCTWNVTLPRDALCEMYSRSNIYVSSGRSEGFDLCAFDAKVAGHVMVHMDYGGPSDFATATDVAVLFEKYAQPPQGYLLPDSTLWPAPTVIEYSNALCEASQFILSAEPVHPFDSARYRIDAVGSQLLDVVRSLAKDHDLPNRGAAE